MADGKVIMNYSRFLGYEKGKDDKPKIVEAEAKVVRDIYQMYLGGMTIRQICAALMERGIPTPGGNMTWAVSTVKSILTNEKYKGDALLQKTFTLDYLTKKMVKNEGQIPSYYVENSHPGIVTPELFNLVQSEVERNGELGMRRNNTSPFSGKVFCPVCGSVYGRKTWRTTAEGEYAKRQVWQCNDKYRERGKICPSNYIPEDELELAFLLAFNQIISDRERYISALEPMLELLTDTTALDADERVLQERAAGIYAQLETLIADNARRKRDQVEYSREYAALRERHNAVKAELDGLSAEKQSHQYKRQNILRFIETLRESTELLDRFDEPLFRVAVTRITIHARHDVAITFRDGQEVHVDARLKKYTNSAR